MRALERLFGSRPARIGIIFLWLILGGLGGSFAHRFQDVQKNEESSFLPGSSESVRELTLAKHFRSGERFAAITVCAATADRTRETWPRSSEHVPRLPPIPRSRTPVRR
jgi:hypothetical protein